MKKILLFAFVSLLLIGCKPYEQQRAEWWWDDWFSYHYNQATDSVWLEKGTKQIKPSQFLYGTRWYNNDYFMD